MHWPLFRWIKQFAVREKQKETEKRTDYKKDRGRECYVPTWRIFPQREWPRRNEAEGGGPMWMRKRLTVELCNETTGAFQVLFTIVVLLHHFTHFFFLFIGCFFLPLICLTLLSLFPLQQLTPGGAGVLAYLYSDRWAGSETLSPLTFAACPSTCPHSPL